MSDPCSNCGRPDPNAPVPPAVLVLRDADFLPGTLTREFLEAERRKAAVAPVRQEAEGAVILADPRTGEVTGRSASYLPRP